MAESDSDPVTGENTAAFQRFYAADPQSEQRGLLYRLFVGWWRDRT